MDKGFLYHRSRTQLWAEIALNLTESKIIPLDVDWYATHLNETFSDIKLRYEHRLEQNNASLSIIGDSIELFFFS